VINEDHITKSIIMTTLKTKPLIAEAVFFCGYLTTQPIPVNEKRNTAAAHPLDRATGKLVSGPTSWEIDDTRLVYVRSENYHHLFKGGVEIDFVHADDSAYADHYEAKIGRFRVPGSLAESARANV